MLSGPWTIAEVDEWLHQQRTPIRLACQRQDGFPAIVSLWFTLHQGALWCATQSSAGVIKMLGRDGKCGFEIATNDMPYCGIRGSGQAHIHPHRGGETLDILLERYHIDPQSKLARWLASRRSSEVAIEIVPEKIQSWDYRERMTG
ncbi:MAG: pyridoxamine 5'-phosphate oxidase family protein [Pseudomonadota bacterium]